LAALLPLLLAASARGQEQVGSFVSGERPMYLQVTPLVEDADFKIELRNVPASAKNPLLIASAAANPVDLTPYGVPGSLGPDLAYAVLIDLDPTTFSLEGTVPTGLDGVTVYLQAYVGLQGSGGRLSSMLTGHVIASGDDPGTDPSVTFPLPLVTQEVLPPGRNGVDRTQQPVRVGVPLPQGHVFESSGVPQLTVLGAPNAAQFSTLARWPDGSVKWALCEYLVDLAADDDCTDWSIDLGSGNFGGSDLASANGSVTTIDTGVLRVDFDSSTPDLFDSFALGGREVFDAARGNQPHFCDDQDLEWTWHETAVTLRRNGPVRAEVEVDGMFTRSSDPDDPDRVLVRFYVEAWQGGSAVRVLASLRDTSVSFPEHLLFRGFFWRAWLAESGPFDVRMPQTSGDGPPPGLWSGTLAAPGENASFFQGFARTQKIQLSYDPNWSTYYPFIERFDDDVFAIEGVRARIGATFLTGDASTGWWTAENEFAEPTFLEINAANGHGVLFGIEHANLHWPVELRAGGGGRVDVALFPRKDSSDAHDYGLTYASAETRAFWVVAEDVPDDDPIAEAFRFDYPLAARAEPWVYNQSGVWHWRLVTTTSVDDYVALAGLRKPAPPAPDAIRTVYEYSNATGGGPNNWGETRRFYQWLRVGLGGAYLSSWYEALYKADKMAWSIDDDELSDRQSIRNPSAPVTRKGEFYNNSKHTFLQAVTDWAYSRGETYLLDSARTFRETLMDRVISPNVQPDGNFVPGTYGAIVNAAIAILELEPDAALEDWVHDICFQWANVVFKVDNSFGIDTSTLGWQAPIGTPPGSAANPDAYMVTWGAGKSSDRAQYGYTTQGWTDLRLGSLAFQRYVHHLREIDPSDPLIADLLGRAQDWYHYAHRCIPDDFQSLTGDFYIIDVFEGDAGDPNVDPFAEPGDDISLADASGYALQSIVNFALEAGLSESALSYGVEMHRSMSKSTYDEFINDPVLNEFIWRYLVHYGLLQP
jgi:hypothetical protein